MSNLSYVSLRPEERAILQEALVAYVGSKRSRSRALETLSKKLCETSYPKITIGIEGGMVQWASGNPFPIRVCDYDIDGCYPRYVDERGRRCGISFEPPDASGKINRYRSA